MAVLPSAERTRKRPHSHPHGARADQFGSLLSPDAAAPRPHPHGADAAVVKNASDDGGVTVGGEGDGGTLECTPCGARADQFGSLLRPDAAAPRPHPRGPDGIGATAANVVV